MASEWKGRTKVVAILNAADGGSDALVAPVQCAHVAHSLHAFGKATNKINAMQAISKAISTVDFEAVAERVSLANLQETI